MKENKSLKSDDRFKEYLTFQIHRNIVNIYKQHLCFIADIRHNHQIMMKKLEKEVPVEYLEDVNYFTDEEYNYLRKKTLDVGNEAIREFERSVENLKITLK